jgi:hypothetical protein
MAEKYGRRYTGISFTRGFLNEPPVAQFKRGMDSMVQIDGVVNAFDDAGLCGWPHTGYCHHRPTPPGLEKVSSTRTQRAMGSYDSPIVVRYHGHANLPHTWGYQEVSPTNPVDMTSNSRRSPGSYVRVEGRGRCTG